MVREIPHLSVNCLCAYVYSYFFILIITGLTILPPKVRTSSCITPISFCRVKNIVPEITSQFSISSIFNSFYCIINITLIHMSSYSLYLKKIKTLFLPISSPARYPLFICSSFNRNVQNFIWNLCPILFPSIPLCTHFNMSLAHTQLFLTRSPVLSSLANHFQLSVFSVLSSLQHLMQ